MDWKTIYYTILFSLFLACGAQEKKEKEEVLYEVEYSKEEWKNLLTDDQYYIMRRSGTERAFTHPFNTNKREGIYLCAADSTQLFDSRYKFNSGTGWPSFSSGNNLEYEWDGRATEVRCITCGSHLGHLFKDGQYTNSHNENRYCINGAALLFTDGTVLEGGGGSN